MNKKPPEPSKTHLDQGQSVVGRRFVAVTPSRHCFCQAHLFQTPACGIDDNGDIDDDASY